MPADHNSIQNFSFDDQLIRVIDRAGDPWFVARDVCAVLGLKNVAQSVEALDDDEKGICSTDTLGGRQEVLSVSESGMYTIVLRSRKAMEPGSVAHRFRRWVTAEVLPAIRRTGAYRVEGAAAAPQIHEDAPLAAKVEAIRLAARLYGRDRAAALWAALGLPEVPTVGHQRDLVTPEEARALLDLILDHVPAHRAARGRPLRVLILSADAGDGSAVQALRDCGLRLIPDWDAVAIANHHPEIEDALAGTRFAGRAWRHHLSALPGARAAPVMKISGRARRGIAVPLALVEGAAHSTPC